MKAAFPHGAPSGLEPADLAALVAAMSDGRGSDAEDVSSASLAEGELAELRDVTGIDGKLPHF